MKIIERNIKNGFLEIIRQRKKERMLQYKFKDDFLEKLQGYFDDNICCSTKTCSKDDDFLNDKIESQKDNINNIELCCEVVDL